MQVVESEKTAKWQYTQHCEELTEEIKKLRSEVSRHYRQIDVDATNVDHALPILNTAQ
jgi:hypothetical protein